MEKKDITGLKRSFVMSIVGILFFLVLITGVTFAWFNMNGLTSTNVTPTGGTISEGEAALLISNHAGGPFDKTCDLVFEGKPDTLEPVSTATLDKFFAVSAQNKDGIAVLYETVGDKLNQLVMHGTVYLQCKNASCSVYFDKENLELGKDGQALAAMRLGLKITSHTGEKTYIFRLDSLGTTGREQSKLTVPQAETVVSTVSEDGQAAYMADPSLTIADYMAGSTAGKNEYDPGTSILVDLDKDEIATVEYWLYLEGCDEQCINPVQNKTSDIRLAFAGVDRPDK